MASFHDITMRNKLQIFMHLDNKDFRNLYLIKYFHYFVAGLFNNECCKQMMCGKFNNAISTAVKLGHFLCIDTMIKQKSSLWSDALCTSIKDSNLIATTYLFNTKDLHKDQWNKVLGHAFKYGNINLIQRIIGFSSNYRWNFHQAFYEACSNARFDIVGAVCGRIARIDWDYALYNAGLSGNEDFLNTMLDNKFCCKRTWDLNEAFVGLAESNNNEALSRLMKKNICAWDWNEALDRAVEGDAARTIDLILKEGSPSNYIDCVKKAIIFSDWSCIRPFIDRRNLPWNDILTYICVNKSCYLGDYLDCVESKGFKKWDWYTAITIAMETDIVNQYECVAEIKGIINFIISRYGYIVHNLPAPYK